LKFAKLKKIEEKNPLERKTWYRHEKYVPLKYIGLKVVLSDTKKRRKFVPPDTNHHLIHVA